MTGEHPLLGLLLSDLGRCLSARFDMLGALEDITSAVHVSEKAVHLTAVDHVDRAEMLDNLSSYSYNLFGRSGAVEDLTRSIQANEEAVEAASPDHTCRPYMLNNLEVRFGERFQLVRSLDDIHKAVQAATEGTDVTPSTREPFDLGSKIAEISHREST